MVPLSEKVLFIHSQMKNCPSDVLRPPAVPHWEFLSLESTTKIQSAFTVPKQKLQVSFVTDITVN